MHESIREGLLARYKTKGYTVARESIHYLRCEAIAREIAAAWRTNERLGNIRDPWRMGLEILDRWERMLALPRYAKDTEKARRTRLAEIFGLPGQAVLYTLVADRARAAVGDRFIAIEHIPVAVAVIHVPNGSYPFGTVAPGVPWSSNVARALVLVQKLAGDTEGAFYEAMGKLTQTLDPILPAWMTFDWYREPVSGGISVVDGPSKAGFFLDDDHNLDNCVFDA